MKFNHAKSAFNPPRSHIELALRICMIIKRIKYCVYLFDKKGLVSRLMYRKYVTIAMMAEVKYGLIGAREGKI